MLNFMVSIVRGVFYELITVQGRKGIVVRKDESNNTTLVIYTIYLWFWLIQTKTTIMKLNEVRELIPRWPTQRRPKWTALCLSSPPRREPRQPRRRQRKRARCRAVRPAWRPIRPLKPQWQRRQQNRCRWCNSWEWMFPTVPQVRKSILEDKSSLITFFFIEGHFREEISTLCPLSFSFW